MDSNKNDSFFRSRFFSGIFGFLLGIAAVFFWQNVLSRFLHFQVHIQSIQQGPNNQMNLESFPEEKDWEPFLDDFMNQNLLDPGQDPFSKLEEMRNKMMKRTHPFDSWYQRKFGGGAPGEIKKREDEQYIYYEISIKGLDQESLSVKVEDGQIDLQGKVEIKDENGNMISSSFHRNFPTPVGVLSQKVEIENQQQDKLVLKFPKIKD